MTNPDQSHGWKPLVAALGLSLVVAVVGLGAWNVSIRARLQQAELACWQASEDVQRLLEFGTGCRALSPYNQHLFAISHDRTVKKLDLETGVESPLAAKVNGQAWATRFSPEKQLVIVAADGRRLEVQRLDGGQPSTIAQTLDGPVICAALSPDCAVVATATRKKTVQVWDAKTFSEIVRLPPQMHEVKLLVISPDNRRLLIRVGAETSPSVSDKVTICDLRSGQEVLSLGGCPKDASEMEFSADGRSLLITSPRGCLIWTAADWQ